MQAILRQVVVVLVGTCSIVNAQSIEPAVLQEHVDAARDAAGLIGAGAAVLVDGNLVAAVVSGKRKANSDAVLTVDDKWHVGSITKSMTSTVIGRLVERDVLQWDSRLADLLPDMATAWNAKWNDVTLLQLLTHTSGLPANVSAAVQLVRPRERKERHVARRAALIDILSQPPKSEPGTTMTYSNVGYTLAGFIAAERAGTTWEDLIEAELFRPLDLKSAGFGPPLGTHPLDQPWGHQRALLMRNAMDPNGLADNTPVIGPAGTVHMSMRDLATYGWEHLRGEAGASSYLKQATFQKLHTAVLEDYACGWVNRQHDWADGRVIWHNGSNTFWYAEQWLVLSREAVVVIVTNDGNISGAQKEFAKLAEAITAMLPVAE